MTYYKDTPFKKRKTISIKKGLTIIELSLLIVTLSTIVVLLQEAWGLSPTKSQSISFSSHMPPEAKKLQIYINHQVATHNDWIGHLSWNKTGGHVMYLGPYSSDPFKVPDSELANICCAPFPPKSSNTIFTNSLGVLVDFFRVPISPLNEIFHFSP